MTRETRIGLLVGLVFIVMFGLVLSELTGTTAEPGPQTSAISPQSLQSWTPVLQKTTHLAAEAPQQQVAPSQYNQQPQVVQMTQQPAQQQVSPVVITHIERQPPVVQIPQVQPSQQVQPSRQVQPAQVAVAPPQAQQRMQTHVVASGDSLIKIARRYYGPQHELEYKRIVEANRGTLANEHMLVVGQELVIPPLPAAQAPQQAQRQPAPAARELTLDQLRREFAPSPQQPAQQARVSPAKTYVVQRGDTLTRIARKHLQDDSRAAIQKLYEANKDRISNPDKVPVGLELVIPG